MTERDHDSITTRSESPVSNVNSAESTLIGSAPSTKGHSFEAETRHADVEPRPYQRRQAAGGRVSDEIENSDEEPSGRETEHLLTIRDDPHATSVIRHPVSAEADDVEPPLPPPTMDAKPEKVSWSQLPRKGQLCILTLSRLSEPLAQTSLQSYMFYQLKSFKDANGNAPSDSTVARQAGLLAAAFTSAQFCTAILWGRAADNSRIGRKRVILIGLLGTCIGALGFGFSHSFAVAAFWRAAGGMLNGNVGVMRTMISEIVREKKYQSRAFLLMPMCFNIGVIIGPLLGGLLADPAGSYPTLFGNVQWMVRWPYAFPNIVNAGFLFGSAIAVIFGLEETLEARRNKDDWGLRIGRGMARTLRSIVKRQRGQRYSELASDDVELASNQQNTPRPKKHAYTGQQRLPFRRMWTRNVCLCLLAHSVLAMHVGTFSNVWFVFLSTPRFDPSVTLPGHKPNSHDLKLPDGYRQKLPFIFTGGLALPPPSIGTALAILGVIGISLQLFLYPRLSFHWGTIRSYRRSLLLFPFSYILAPFLAILPSVAPPPHQASGPVVWIGITVVLAIQVMARTFALPAAAILINNACPHPSVLGTMHGIGQTFSSFSRTIGPGLAGLVYGVGLSKGVVGLAWWWLAAIALVGTVAGAFVREGDGHEVKLEGEDDAAEKPP